EGIRVAMRMLDCREDPTKLAWALGSVYGVNTADDMRKLVDSSPFGKVEVAAFAIHVSEVADDGDPIAQEILRRAGRDLGMSVVAIINRLAMGEETFPISTVGSVFDSRPWVTESFERVVLTRAPRAFLHPSLHPPAVGAALLGF